MSVVIRLTKMGKRGESRYRVVVAEKRSARDGKPIETLGWYNKQVDTKTKEINKARYDYWIAHGAKPSPTVANLMKL